MKKRALRRWAGCLAVLLCMSASAEGLNNLVVCVGPGGRAIMEVAHPGTNCAASTAPTQTSVRTKSGSLPNELGTACADIPLRSARLSDTRLKTIELTALERSLFHTPFNPHETNDTGRLLLTRYQLPITSSLLHAPRGVILLI